MKYLVLFAFLFAAPAYAQLTNESTLGLVIVDGNAESSTTTIKQKNSYLWEELNKVTATAEMTETEADDVVTAKAWSALLRYDRRLSEVSGLYLSHLWESNRFAGFTQRDTFELGYAHDLIKKDNQKWVAEIGYSQRTVDVAGSDEELDSPGISLSSNYSYSKDKSVTYALDVKYRHDLEDDDRIKNNTLRVEPSVSTVLSDILSLKVAYLIENQSNPQPAGTEDTDTTLTTNLVAKF